MLEPRKCFSNANNFIEVLIIILQPHIIKSNNGAFMFSYENMKIEFETHSYNHAVQITNLDSGRSVQLVDLNLQTLLLKCYDYAVNSILDVKIQ